MKSPRPSAPAHPSLVAKTSRVLVAGHTGLVGSAVHRALVGSGYSDLVTASIDDVDLTDQAATRSLLRTTRPEAVVLAAARVGGILANFRHPYAFVHDNLAIELNIVSEAFDAGVRRLIFLGSSCIYPRLAPQPLKEEYLLTGLLEETNRPYAVAKIAGIELCRSLNREFGTDYLCAMPTNLYGPGDNFDLATSHVLPAMIRKFHDAKANGNEPVQLWGTGTPRREFLHVDDLARALVFLLESVSTATLPEGMINIGTGKDVSIRELSELVQRIVGHTGPIEWDPAKPDGTPRKLLDVGLLRALGWTPSFTLEEGIRTTYEWYRTATAPRCAGGAPGRHATER